MISILFASPTRSASHAWLREVARSSVGEVNQVTALIKFPDAVFHFATLERPEDAQRLRGHIFDSVIWHPSCYFSDEIRQLIAHLIQNPKLSSGSA